MSTTRKQKEARKSRESDMLSDIENHDKKLGGNNLERGKASLVTLAESLIVRVMMLQ